MIERARCPEESLRENSGTIGKTEMARVALQVGIGGSVGNGLPVDGEVVPPVEDGLIEIRRAEDEKEGGHIRHEMEERDLLARGLVRIWKSL
mmetsp:Transcript_2328/g.4708  ORF Transcript_2328/g.4708 Transcript_2328/m.4708 type:complete len:92 (-) Transcript_2328:371-646(-)